MKRYAFLLFVLLTAATNASAGSTSLSMWSDAGDYIGDGQPHRYASSDGTFTARRNFDNGVSISFNTPMFTHWWHLDFSAPQDQLLIPGVYSGAVRYPFQPPDIAGLSVSGDGRGCNTLTGNFEVLEVTYGTGDEVVAFRATFEQHCEGAAPALRGEIRFNATVPIELTAPTDVAVIEGSNLSFQVTAVAIGGSVVLSGIDVPPRASFVDNGNNTGTFNWTPAAGQAGQYVIGFSAANAGGATETVFTRITVRAPPPDNDDFNDATAITLLPFATTQNTAAATVAFDDPFCNGPSATVWFAYTAPARLRIEANTFGSSYDTALSVYTGARGSLMPVACNDNADGTAQSRVVFDASPGVTYFFMVSAFAFGSGGPLSFNVLEGPPPLSISTNVFRFGHVSLTTGVAEVTGSVSCSQGTFVHISGQLRQQHGGSALIGFFFASQYCDGSGEWHATVFVAPTLFHGRAAALFTGGPATVTATAFAFNPETGENVQQNFVARIVLRGSQ